MIPRLWDRLLPVAWPTRLTAVWPWDHVAVDLADVNERIAAAFRRANPAASWGEFERRREGL
jgi:hypothetical protein